MSPPMISDSLLASASVVPASRAASVAVRPTEPVIALSTTSARRPATSADAPGPTTNRGRGRSSGAIPRCPAYASIAASTSRTASSRLTPTTGASMSTICRASNSACEPPAARPTTRNRSGQRPTISTAWVPTDPVDPSTTTSRRSTSAILPFPAPQRFCALAVRAGRSRPTTSAQNRGSPRTWRRAGRCTPVAPTGPVPRYRVLLRRLQLGSEQADDAGHQRRDDPDQRCDEQLRPLGRAQGMIRVEQRLLGGAEVEPRRRVLQRTDQAEQDRPGGRDHEVEHDGRGAVHEQHAERESLDDPHQLQQGEVPRPGEAEVPVTGAACYAGADHVEQRAQRQRDRDR